MSGGAESWTAQQFGPQHDSSYREGSGTPTVEPTKFPQVFYYVIVIKQQRPVGTLEKEATSLLYHVYVQKKKFHSKTVFLVTSPLETLLP